MDKQEKYVSEGEDIWLNYLFLFFIIMAPALGVQWQYLGCIGCDLGSLWVVSCCEESVELASKQLFSSGKVITDGHAEG